MRFKNNGMPPGGITFIDPKVPSMKWNDGHTGLNERVKEVIRFRRANPQIYVATDGKYFDFQQVAEEIINYNCARIGYDRNWCYDETKDQANVGKPTYVAPQSVCPACGCQLVPRYCKTCGGHKINGYDCPQCKKSY